MTLQPPYPGDGFVHVNVPGRAVARCGLPDSQNWELCALESAAGFELYPVEDRCPACVEMLESDASGPRIVVEEEVDAP